MKKIVSILSAAALLMAAVFSVNVKEVKAEENTVIHVKNEIGWKSVNIYNWGDDGEVAGAWPGTAMTDEGNGWYTISFEVKGKMNLVFCVDEDGDGTAESQTGDLKDVDASSGEVWIALQGGETEENALGAAVAGTPVLLDGKPDDYAGAEEKEEVEEKAEEDAESETQTEGNNDEEAETQEDSNVSADKDSTPATGDAANVAILLIMLASAAAYVISKKVSVE